MNTATVFTSTSMTRMLQRDSLIWKDIKSRARLTRAFWQVFSRSDLTLTPAETGNQMALTKAKLIPTTMSQLHKRQKLANCRTIWSILRYSSRLTIAISNIWYTSSSCPVRNHRLLTLKQKNYSYQGLSNNRIPLTEAVRLRHKREPLFE